MILARKMYNKCIILFLYRICYQLNYKYSWVTYFITILCLCLFKALFFHINIKWQALNLLNQPNLLHCILCVDDRTQLITIKRQVLSTLYDRW